MGKLKFICVWKCHKHRCALIRIKFLCTFRVFYAKYHDKGQKDCEQLHFHKPSDGSATSQRKFFQQSNLRSGFVSEEERKRLFNLSSFFLFALSCKNIMNRSLTTQFRIKWHEGVINNGSSSQREFEVHLDKKTKNSRRRCYASCWWDPEVFIMLKAHFLVHLIPVINSQFRC